MRKFTCFFDFLVNFHRKKMFRSKRIPLIAENCPDNIESEFSDDMINFKYFITKLKDFSAKGTIAAFQFFKIIFDVI